MSVIVDHSNLTWTCWYAGPDWQANLLTKLGTISSILNETIGSFIFVLDERDEVKYQAFPEYKAGRVKPDFDPRTPAIELIRGRYGSRFVFSPGKEADDCMASVARQLSFERMKNKHTKPITVVTGDRDMWELLRLPGLQIFDPIQRELVDTPRIEKAFGVTDPRHIRMVKTLWGDSSDNIPNVVPRMQKALLPVIKSLQDVELTEFYEKCGLVQLSNRCIELLHNNRDAIRLNWNLVSLDFFCPVVEAK